MSKKQIELGNVSGVKEISNQAAEKLSGGARMSKNTHGRPASYIHSIFNITVSVPW